MHYSNFNTHTKDGTDYKNQGNHLKGKKNDRFATHGSRNYKNDEKHQLRSLHKPSKIWCPVHNEICGSEWNSMDTEWHWQAVKCLDMAFVGLTDIFKRPFK